MARKRKQQYYDSIDHVMRCSDWRKAIFSDDPHRPSSDQGQFRTNGILTALGVERRFGWETKTSRKWVTTWIVFLVVSLCQIITLAATNSELFDPKLTLRLEYLTNLVLRLDWPSENGSVYQLQYSTHLPAVSWLNFGDPITATADHSSLIQPRESWPQCFYRVAQTAAILFKDDFETDEDEVWTFYAGEPGAPGGWQVETEPDGNRVLSGMGHYWASLSQPYTWSNFRLRVRVQLLAGGIHLNYRINSQGRYFIGFSPGGILLSKQYFPNTFFSGIASSSAPNAMQVWHTVEIVGESGNIRVRVDGDDRINYTDPDPILNGSIAFEAFLDSHIHLDDIAVIGPPPKPPGPHLTWVRTGGPLGGIGYDVRIDPTNPQTIYATDAFSGVSKSEDGGALWAPMNQGITSRSGSSGDAIPVFCLTIDPRNAQVIWIGTQNMRGIYKSTDGGQKWIKSDSGIPDLPGITFRSFTIDPINSDLVYAGTEVPTDRIGPDGQNEARGKIFKTMDGGKSWTEILDCGALVRWMAIDPDDTQVLYAATGIFDRDEVKPEGVLKSTDGGRTWQNINNGLPNLTVGGLAMDPRNAKVLYATTGRSIGFGGGPEAAFGGVYKTTDGGESWVEVLHRANDNFFVPAIALAGTNPDIIYIALGGGVFYRSQDAGKTWQLFPMRPDDATVGIPIALTVDPAKANVIFLNSYIGGVFKSINGGETWHVASQGYTGADIRDVGMNPRQPTQVWAIGRQGVAKSEAGGDGWIYLNHAGADQFVEGASLSVNPLNANDVLMANAHWGTILRTIDGGATWRQVLGAVTNGHYPENIHGIAQFARYNGNPNIVYAAGRMANESMALNRYTRSIGLFKTIDGGENWQGMNAGLISDLNINTVAIHPTDVEVVYVGVLNGGVYRTTNGGVLWQSIGGNFAMDVRALAIDPRDPKVIYAGTAGSGLFYSTDGGQTWKNTSVGLDPNASIGSIIIDPTNSAIVWAADVRSGVYRSLDGGKTWETVNDGLLIRAVNALAISSDGQILYAATSGGGVFRIGILAP